LHRVGIWCFLYNPGAVKLFERLGFVNEGKERESIWYDVEWHDKIIMGLLENGWRVRNKKREEQN
jgi:RimJ/RimL family protein N-acetyltransferase